MIAGVEPAAAAAAGPAGADLPETAARAVDPSPEVLDGKHKLSRRWTIIHGAPNPSNPKDWKKVMTDVVTVGTAEDLIAALAALETPSSLIGRVEGHQLFVFQEGARPDWKDPHVKSKGGRWDLPLRFTVSSSSRVKPFRARAQAPACSLRALPHTGAPWRLQRLRSTCTCRAPASLRSPAVGPHRCPGGS